MRAVDLEQVDATIAKWLTASLKNMDFNSEKLE